MSARLARDAETDAYRAQAAASAALYMAALALLAVIVALGLQVM